MERHEYFTMAMWAKQRRERMQALRTTLIEGDDGMESQAPEPELIPSVQTEASYDWADKKIA